MSAIQDQVLTLTTTAGAVLATCLVALLGWGPQIPLDQRSSDDVVELPLEPESRADGEVDRPEAGPRPLWPR